MEESSAAASCVHSGSDVQWRCPHTHASLAEHTVPHTHAHTDAKRSTTGFKNHNTKEDKEDRLLAATTLANARDAVPHRPPPPSPRVFSRMLHFPPALDRVCRDDAVGHLHCHVRWERVGGSSERALVCTFSSSSSLLGEREHRRECRSTGEKERGWGLVTAEVEQAHTHTHKQTSRKERDGDQHHRGTVDNHTTHTRTQSETREANREKERRQKATTQTGQMEDARLGGNNEEGARGTRMHERACVDRPRGNRAGEPACALPKRRVRTPLASATG